VAAALPRYTLGEQLGAGSFGLVLAGRHRDLDRAVAVKVLPIDDPADGARLTAAFRDEARMLSRLDHPHIVRIYEYIGQDDCCLLIMELLGGGTLAQHRLSPEAACAVGLAVADGLAHAHAQGVLHRDVKPDNILFTVAGQPKLTDFGIGRVFEDASLTTSHLVGTPRYMAPEQVAGAHLGPAADQYALGVVLYELLAGRPLFNPQLPVPELLRHHLEEAPPALRDAPTPVAEVVMTALAKAPADRYPDAAAFGRALADAAAAAYGPDWLALTGLIVRLQEPADGQLRRANPDSGGNVFTPATAHLDGAPAHVVPTTPPDAATDRYVPTAGPSQAGSAAEASTALPTATADAGAGAGSPGPVPAGDAPAEDTHPFAGTQFGYNRSGRRKLLRRRAVLGAAATLAALALAVTAVVLVAASGGGGTGAVVTSPTTTAAQAAASLTQIAIPSTFNGWAAGPDGVLYFSDSTSNRVLRRDRSGKVTPVAGTGYAGTSGEGGLATSAALNDPTSLALDGSGNLYILQAGRIRRVDPQGDITTVAGGGDGPNVTTPGPISATSTSIDPEGHMAVDTNGDIYVADSSTVYKVDARQRLLTRVARIGKPENQYTPLPGSPDLDAGLPLLVADGLAGLAVHDGLLYAAGDNNVITVLERDGKTVTPVAGTKQPGYSGDGGPATAASLDLVQDPWASAIALDATGTKLYIADAIHHRVRLVSHGIISLVAGNGDSSAFTENQPAVHQPLYGPGKIAVADDGTLLIENGTAIVRVDDQGLLRMVQEL
jgi:hypothetical protein